MGQTNGDKTVSGLGGKGQGLYKDSNSDWLCPSSHERKLHSFIQFPNYLPRHFYFHFSFWLVASPILLHVTLPFPTSIWLCHTFFCILSLSSSFISQGFCTSHSLYLESSFCGSLQIGPYDILRDTSAYPISHSPHPIIFSHNTLVASSTTLMMTIHSLFIAYHFLLEYKSLKCRDNLFFSF